MKETTNYFNLYSLPFVFPLSMSLSSAINSFNNSFVLVSFNPRLPTISAVLCHSPSFNSNRLISSYYLTYIFQIYYFTSKTSQGSRRSGISWVVSFIQTPLCKVVFMYLEMLSLLKQFIYVLFSISFCFSPSYCHPNLTLLFDCQANNSIFFYNVPFL